MVISMPKIVECVPNFSEGKDQAKLDKILNAIKSVEGVTLLDWEKDADHNRSVVTIAGEPEKVKIAVYNAVEAAIQVIDLTKHKGEHPRMGATDVVPFVPISDITMEECIEIAKEVAEEISKRFNIPTYLYDKAAQIPGREKLPEVRKGQFEGIRDSIKTDPSRKPDYGASEVHSTAGATAVGARAPLVAFNVYLDTDDVEIVKVIGKAVRSSGGGLRSVRGMGFDTKPYVQVSMNMIDFHDTPLHAALEFIRMYANQYGFNVIGTEIVGLVPRDALLDAAEFYLQLTGPGKPWPAFKRDQILENKLEK